eukprot:13160639-Alexandrium_andersonii.AAC.1
MCDKGNAVVFLPGFQKSFMCRADHLDFSISGPAVNIRRKGKLFVLPVEVIHDGLQAPLMPLDDADTLQELVNRGAEPDPAEIPAASWLRPFDQDAEENDDDDDLEILDPPVQVPPPQPAS